MGNDGGEGTANGAASIQNQNSSIGFGMYRRPLKTLRFKLPPAAAAATGLSLRQRRTVCHVFHPVYPFAMSISAAFMQPQTVSFHFRWEQQ